MAEFKPNKIFEKMAKEHYEKVRPGLPWVEEVEPKGFVEKSKKWI